eukprot:1087615-Ditylum_brightwellii.AAC.1
MLLPPNQNPAISQHKKGGERMLKRTKQRSANTPSEYVLGKHIPLPNKIEHLPMQQKQQKMLLLQA